MLTFRRGGGRHQCAGKSFAKAEILFTVAVLLVGFDIEVVGWEMLSKGESYAKGIPSDRAASVNPSHYGFGVLKPDRDLRIKIKKKGSW